mgnify:CR=1 FL=1
MGNYRKIMSDVHEVVRLGANENFGTYAERFASEYAAKVCAEANKKLAEQQARIKVLEDDMRMIKTSADSSEGICDNGYSAAYIAEQALSTTSPSEALDKVVREAVEKERKRYTVAGWIRQGSKFVSLPEFVTEGDEPVYIRRINHEQQRSV